MVSTKKSASVDSSYVDFALGPEKRQRNEYESALLKVWKNEQHIYSRGGCLYN